MVLTLQELCFRMCYAVPKEFKAELEAAEKESEKWIGVFILANHLFGNSAIINLLGSVRTISVYESAWNPKISDDYQFCGYNPSHCALNIVSMNRERDI